jgi:DNA-binding CsgD family transcriptional regulator
MGGAQTFGRRRGGAQTPAQMSERLMPLFLPLYEDVSPAAADRLTAVGRQMRWDALVAEGLAEAGVDTSPLSRREHEIADLVAEGLTNAGIAEKLVISRRTVDSHIDHIKQKLGLKSRNEIIVWVLRSSAA